MEKDYTTLGYSAETAASVMGVLVLISSGGQAVGSDVQVRNRIGLTGRPLFAWIYSRHSTGFAPCILK